MAISSGVALSHFVATDCRHLDSLLRVAPISSEDVVLDIGSGDGRFLKCLVAATGCRGIGIEICSSLHHTASRTCSKEIADGRLLFINAPAEDVELQRSDALARMGGIAYAYLYLLPATVRTCPALLKLLDELLSSGVFVITNTFVLPSVVAACKVAQWPPEFPAVEELGEVISRSSMGASSCNFHVYRRLRMCAQPRRAWETCGAAVLARLRGEPVVQEALARFQPHPWVSDAGALGVAAKFKGLWLVHNHCWQNVGAFAALAGHEDFGETLLFSAMVVPAPLHAPGVDGKTDLWHPILAAYALLGQAAVDKGRSLGVEEHTLVDAARSCPSFMAVLRCRPVVAAAAVAVSIHWTMRLFGPMLEHIVGTSAGHADVVRRCHMLRLGLDQRACRAMEEAEGWLNYEDIQGPVLQLFEEQSANFELFLRHAGGGDV